MFWKKKRAQARQAANQARQTVDEVTTAATDLAEKSLVIGASGVLVLLGAAAVGAAATYVLARRRKNKEQRAGERQ
jgi:hypothetical protein